MKQNCYNILNLKKFYKFHNDSFKIKLNRVENIEIYSHFRKNEYER